MPIEVRTAIGVWAVAWLAISVLGAVVTLVVGVADDPLDASVGAIALLVVFGGVGWALALWIASERLSGIGWRSAYAVRFRPADLGALVVGAVAQLVVIPAVYVPLRWWWPEFFSEDAVRDFAQRLFERATDPVNLIVLVAVVVIGAPLVEEFVYRGLLQRSLTTRLSAVVAVVAVSGLFAAIHLRPVEFPGLFAAGVVFGACLAVTDRIATAVLAHVGFNLTGVVLVWPS